MSKRGRFPGSSFIQILTSLDMCEDMPGGNEIRRPSKATCRYKQKVKHDSLYISETFIQVIVLYSYIETNLARY